MGIFSQKAKFKVAPQVVRKVSVPVEPAKKTQATPRGPPATTRPRLGATTQLSVRAGSNGSGGGSGTATPTASPRSPPHRSRPAAERSTKARSTSDRPTTDRPVNERKRKLARKPATTSYRASPARDRVAFDDDSDDDAGDDNWEAALQAHEQRKRARLARPVDTARQLVHPVLLATAAAEAETEAQSDKPAESASEPSPPAPPVKHDLDAEEPGIIHASSLASVELKCTPVMGAAPDAVAVELQYPGSRHRERYELVWGKDKIEAVKDIKSIVQLVAEEYLTADQRAPFLDPTTGIVRRLERASSSTVNDADAFKAALDDFNTRLLALHTSGALAANLRAKHDLPSHLVAFILDQVYDRTVAPKVELLRKYENGTDNVYGELLHPFVTDILVDRLQMTSGQVFVDLGSGVGNVALQAALEIGCESWGCEMMENACNLADAQAAEFAARCRLWGVAPGAVHLERGDFRANAAVQAVLKRADVVLVNNQAFTSQLNDDLVRMFLDFKSGCKIVSLKSFVHDHKSASHNINDVGSTILDVEMLTYPEGYVSWTGAAGRFCISTRR